MSIEVLVDCDSSFPIAGQWVSGEIGESYVVAWMTQVYNALTGLVETAFATSPGGTSISLANVKPFPVVNDAQIYASSENGAPKIRTAHYDAQFGVFRNQPISGQSPVFETSSFVFDQQVTALLVNGEGQAAISLIDGTRLASVEIVNVNPPAPMSMDAWLIGSVNNSFIRLNSLMRDGFSIPSTEPLVVGNNICFIGDRDSFSSTATLSVKSDISVNGIFSFLIKTVSYRVI